MNKIIQFIAASAAAVCGFLFGEFDGLMYALIAFMVLDYLSRTRLWSPDMN
jgi:phage-related holin